MHSLQLDGKVFGRLTVIKRLENTAGGKSRWLCKCSCGKTTTPVGSKLAGRKTTSCGCLGLENATKVKTKHGDALCGRRAPLYKKWAAMHRRCTNTNAANYPYYGGKGISVCLAWKSYASFRNWAESSGYKEGLEIDRIDSSKDYSPDNCQWLTGTENKLKMHREKAMR